MADFVEFNGQLDQEQGGHVPFSGQMDKPTPARGRTMTEDFMRQLGLTTRHAVSGVTGMGGVLADALTAVPNMMGANLPRPSEALQQKMTQLGLPEAETPLEKGVGFLTSAGFGAGDPLLKATQSAINARWPGNPAPALPPDPSVTNVTRELHEKGISLPPSRMEGTGPARALEGIAGGKTVEQTLAIKNQPVFQNLIREELRLPKDVDLTPEVLTNNVKHWVAKGYDPVTQVPFVGIGGKFRQAMADIVRDFGGGNSFPRVQGNNPVKNLVDDYLFDKNHRYLKYYTGEDAVARIKLLREEATAAFKNNDPTMGHVKRRIADAIEENIELTLKASPRYKDSNLLQNFQQARSEIAKSYAVEKMLVDKSTGVIDPRKAHALLQFGTPLTGNLRTVAQAGSPMYGPSTNPPTKGSPLPFDLGNLWMGGGLGAMANYVTGHPGMAAGMAALPVARIGARHLVASPWYQARLAENLGQGPGYLMSAPGQRSVASSMLELPFFSQGQP